jgi:hypothetical protein
MNLLRASILLVAILIVGCSEKHSSADVGRGQKALIAALDSWKANEPVEKLKSAPDPIEFTDEIRATHQLIEYTVGTSDAKDPEVVRYRVSLKLKDRKGKQEDREIVFMVALKTPIVIARDPYE